LVARPGPRPRSEVDSRAPVAGGAAAAAWEAALRSCSRRGEDRMTVDEARAQFPVFERLAYLNAGTNGPLTRATVEAMAEQERADLERGRGGSAYFERALGLRDEVRAKLAGLVGVPPENMALATSTTNGCN